MWLGKNKLISNLGSHAPTEADGHGGERRHAARGKEGICGRKREEFQSEECVWGYLQTIESTSVSIVIK